MGADSVSNGSSAGPSTPKKRRGRSPTARSPASGSAGAKGKTSNGSNSSSSHHGLSDIVMSPRAKLSSSAQMSTERPTKLLQARVWDVIMPPPVNSVKGHFVPSGLVKRHRRVSVEVHRVLPAVDPTAPREDKDKDKDDDKTKEDAAKKKDDKKDDKKKKEDGKKDAKDAKAADAAAKESVVSRSLRALTGSSKKSLAGGATEDEANAGYEECYVRILVPATSKAMAAAKGVGNVAVAGTKGIGNVAVAGTKGVGNVVGTTARGVGSVAGAAGRTITGSAVVLDDDDSVAVAPTPVSPPRRAGKGGNHMAGIPEDAPEGGSYVAGTVPTPTTQWAEKYRFPLSDFVMKKRVSNSCVATTKLDEAEHTREIVFDTDREAADFAALVEEHSKLEEIRSKKRLASAMGGLTVKNLDEELDLLIEVVSGSDLPAADLLTSDPMVRVMWHGEQIHKTKFISSTLNPVWTIKTHSLCLLSVTARELFASHDGVTFVVQDYDKFGGNEDLGAVMIPPKMLYAAKGERVECPLRPLYGKHDYGTGKLAVRVRRASDHDKEFIAKWKAEQKALNAEKKHKTDAATTSKGGSGTIKSIVTRNEKVEKHEGPNKGKKLYKMRPGPDPKRVEETEWLTKDQLLEESLKDSQHWIDIGSGKLGRVYVEIIGCDGLPQLDSGGMFGNKTDAFVNLVFEDSIANTDVIDDTLSPRWMPWSQRAFVLNMMHSSSQLFLGVYDYDEGFMDDHDLIGRVSVDISNFYPDTVYNLEYNIYPTAKTSYMREAQGKIKFRLRIEYSDERQLVLSNLEPPPPVHVNVKTRKEFRCTRYTTTGRVDMESYSTKTISMYIEEIMTYMEAYFYLEDALVNVLLWRGHFPVKIGSYTLRLPLHSLNLFLGAVFLVEKPQLIPSFSCAWTAWILLAVMGYRRNNPDPWDRCKSFGEILQMVILGTETSGPQTIEAYENAEAAEEFHKKWQKRLEDAEKLAEKKREQAIKDQEEWQKEMDEIGETNVDISTKVGGGPSIDPLKPILFPIQQYLGIIVNCLRFTKNVVVWEECYFAFLISAGSLVLAIAFAFVPWFFIMKWTSRLMVWSLFGPWMKLVDIFWYSKLKPLSEDELKEQEARLKREKRERTKAAAEEARLAREDAKKLKDMKKYMFGKFITKVSLLKLDRFKDNPLPASTATPYNQEAIPMSELAMREAGRNRTRVPGQHLVGDMIPTIEAPEIREAPTGQPTGKPGLLKKDSPGANVGKDSNANAATKIGGIVFAAAVLTWFGVPLMISGVKYVFKGSFSDSEDVMTNFH